MKVTAKTLGEHPQGTWRQPGETFEFNGKELALWMISDPKAPKKAVKSVEDVKFKAVHKGFGKWDVINSDLETVENGKDLNKTDSTALVETLLSE